jgi:long-chain acyl-CoA synthetase
MLYDRWSQIAQQFQNAVALRDLAGGRQWTFRELDQAAGSEPEPGVCFPQGSGGEFIVTVLRAWRFGRVICPIEPGHHPPALPGCFPPDCVHLKLTSGTTGPAQMIAFKAEQLAADAENIVATMGLRHDSSNLGVISLAHSYGFSNLVLPLLLHGIPLVLAPSPLPETVRSALLNLTNVTLPAVPALWRTWHEAGIIKNVRLAISAGAPLPIALEKSVFESLGLKVHNFYGSSECGGIAYDRSDLPREEIACVGTSMENVTVAVGESGCLEIRSKAVWETYWPEANEALAGGVFRTHDLADLKDGMVYLRGRASDQINVAGRKISPEAIEKILGSHPEVSECLVFGAPSVDAERTETVVACVVSSSLDNADVLRSFLLSQIPAWQVPREWFFLNSLQVNGRGKISRAEWRQKFLAGKL